MNKSYICFVVIINIVALVLGYYFGRMVGMIQAYYMDKKQLREKIWGKDEP